MSSAAKHSNTEPELADRLLLAVIRLGRKTRPSHSASGIAPSHFLLLAGLSRRGATRISDLAKADQTSLPVMTRQIVVLEQAGLVTKRTSDTDRRSTLVAITDAGRAKLREHFTERAGLMKQELDQLTAVDLEAIAAAVIALEKVTGPYPLGS